MSVIDKFAETNLKSLIFTINMQFIHQKLRENTINDKKVQKTTTVRTYQYDAILSNPPECSLLSN